EQLGWTGGKAQNRSRPRDKLCKREISCCKGPSGDYGKGRQKADAAAPSRSHNFLPRALYSFIKLGLVFFYPELLHRADDSAMILIANSLMRTLTAETARSYILAMAADSQRAGLLSIIAALLIPS